MTCRARYSGTSSNHNRLFCEYNTVNKHKLTLTFEFPDDRVEESVLRRDVPPSNRHPHARSPAECLELKLTCPSLGTRGSAPRQLHQQRSTLTYPNSAFRFPEASGGLFTSRNSSKTTPGPVKWRQTNLARDMWDAELCVTGTRSRGNAPEFDHSWVLGYPFVQLKRSSRFHSAKKRDAINLTREVPRSSRFDNERLVIYTFR